MPSAFTRTASSNIEGQTLHASFGFAFDNKHYSLSDKSRDQKRAALQKLKMVKIDEVSMVKADMLYQLDLRLQEITEKIGDMEIVHLGSTDTKSCSVWFLNQRREGICLSML